MGLLRLIGDGSTVLDATHVTNGRTANHFVLAARWPLPARALRTLASGMTITLAFLAAAWLGGTPPFEGNADNPYSEARVVRAIPFDTPLPYSMSLAAGGRGEELPYFAQWTSGLAPNAMLAEYREHLAGSPRWRILTEEVHAGGTYSSTLARTTDRNTLTHYAQFSITRDSMQTVVELRFTPVPVSLAPD
jgi:hypothetical protein